MSAGLLKRAAEKLRAAAEPIGPAPWASTGDGHVFIDFPSGPWLVVSADKPNAEYIALMHPPVALALATLMEAHARLLDAERAAGKPFTDLFAATELFDIARAILREVGGD